MPVHPKVPALEAVLRDLYGSLADDVSFTRCLGVVATPLRSHFAGLHHEDIETNSSRVEIWGQATLDECEALTREYAARWSGQNLWLQKGMERILRYGYGDGDDAMAESELFAMPYYQHFLRRLDVRHGLGICLWRNGDGQMGMASFNRSAAEGPFGPEVMAFIGELRPHLANAYAIYRRATNLHDTNRSLRATMDQAPVGMLVMDSLGRVLDANLEAERIMRAHGGITRSGLGFLVLERASDQHRLQAALVDLSKEVSPTLNRSLLVVKPGHSAAEGIAVHLCAVPALKAAASAARVVAFLCPMTGPCADKLASLVLQSALTLTAAEARAVIALHRNHDLASAATALGVEVTTVRTHLKHAFAKTGTHKQSELLTLVERLLARTPLASEQ